MPELPEVETVVRGLQKSLPGRRVLNVRFGKTDFIDDPAAVGKQLPGKKISAVRRFGKFIVFDLDSANGDPDVHHSLLIHLGMTGRLITYDPESPIEPHTHVFFSLDDGRELRYTDIRRFGRMALVSDSSEQSELGELGLDPLEATERQFVEMLRGRRARIKALLLDQHVLRGMGNIYADESLWRARIHPMRIARNLSPKQLGALYHAVQSILHEAIRLKGSSVNNYVDSEGASGSFQLKHRVYRRHGQGCSRCGGKIRRAIVAGRSSHFCPACQPAPRNRS